MSDVDELDGWGWVAWPVAALLWITAPRRARSTSRARRASPAQVLTLDR